jgi:hypothetical protein
MDVIAHVIDRRRELSQMCGHGFPLVDGLYWDRPSPMLAGLLLRTLRLRASASGGSVLDLRYPSSSPRSIDETIAALKRAHKPGMWYRGQRSRRSCRYQGTIPAIDRSAVSLSRRYNPIEVILEGTVPSFFRSITRADPAQWSRFLLRPPLDNFAGPVRAILASREPRLHSLLADVLDQLLFENIRLLQLDRVVLGYDDKLLAAGTTVPHATLEMISLSQHYEYGSIMIDVTRDVDTAVWFATRDWSTGEVAGSDDGSPGVIYRFDGHRLQAMMRNHLTGPGAMPPPAVNNIGVFGLADISERFRYLGRPSAQHGGSLLGMESFLTHFLIWKSDAARAFEFDHRTVASRGTALTREDICPSADAGLDIFRPHRKFPNTPIPWEELKDSLAMLEISPERRSHFVEMRKAGVI